MSLFARDISELKKEDKNLTSSHRFLQSANCHKEMNPLLNELIIEIKSLTGCCAVGMRILDEEGNIPYERVRAEEALQKSNEELERQVEVHTTELVLLNQQLNLEIEERQCTEEELLIYQDKLRSLSSELLFTVARERREIATELHDRIGFDTSGLSSLKPSNGDFGLFSILERLRPLGGRLEIESEPGSGSRVTIVLPLSCTPENTRESHVP